jgi:heptosyltransferase II
VQLTPDTKLVVRLPKWLGDAVACEPVLRALDDFYRSAGRIEHLTVAAPMRTVMLISHQHPGVQWMPTDRSPADGPAGWRGFDAALLLTNSFRSAWMVFRARVPERIGWARDGRGLLLTQGPSAPREKGGAALGLAKKGGWPRHLPRGVGAGAIELVQMIGVTVRDPRPRLVPTEEGLAAAKARFERLRLAPDAPYVLANVGARPGSPKALAPAVFAAAIAELHRRTGLATLLACGPGERDLLHAVQDADPGKDVYPCADPTVDLPELVALASRARVVLGSDTGPRHVCAAAGAPVVVVCGPTDPRHTAAGIDDQRFVRIELDCSPCHLEACPLTGDAHHACMTRVPPDRVVAAAEELLALTPSA